MVGLEDVRHRPDIGAAEIGAPQRLEVVERERVDVEVEHALDFLEQLGQEQPVPHGCRESRARQFRDPLVGDLVEVDRAADRALEPRAFAAHQAGGVEVVDNQIEPAAVRRDRVQHRRAVGDVAPARGARDVQGHRSRYRWKRSWTPSSSSTSGSSMAGSSRTSA